MIHRRVRGLLLLHCSAQTVGALLLFWALVFVFQTVPDAGLSGVQQYVVYAVLVVAGFVAFTMRASLWNANLLNLGALQCAQLTFRQLVHVAAPLFIFLVATKDMGISRAFLFIYCALLAGCLFLTNRRLPMILADLCFRGRRQQRTLLCGIPEDFAKIQPWINRKTSFGMQLRGFVSLRPQSGKMSTGDAWESVDDLEAIITRERINQVILSRTLPAAELQALSNRCDTAGSRLFILHDLEQQIGRPVRFVRDEGFNFMTLREEPLECPLNRLMKRTLDVCIALPVVLFVLPWVSLLVWLIHRLQSPGPLLFLQHRTGLHNEHFSILKFRTMHVENGDEAKQATVDDPRIFRLGKLLRKLSIDELPQFVNVLRGDMSVVGPRPHMSEHDTAFAKVAEVYRVRAFIKPGITGLAQVRGHRGETKTSESVRARVASDLDYLENWSPMLDLLIIFKTAWQMIRPHPGAR